MTRVHWRWAEKDFGFRFRVGGRTKAEYYQAAEPGSYYAVPAKHRKLTKERVEELAAVQPPTSPRTVPMPWRDYDREWDWISTEDGVLLNYAGCLDQEEIHRREDEGVARAMELVVARLELAEPATITLALIRELHIELMGAVYPFAGAWRQVAMHKGEGPTKWPLPPGGIDPMMTVFERDVLARSPVIAADDETVFRYASEVMGELLAIHPFREGNGRAAFILGNLVLMQNNCLPLDVYDRRSDEERYYAACEAARVRKDYAPLSAMLAEWQAAAQSRWEMPHGN